MTSTPARARRFLLDSGHLATIVVVTLAYLVSLAGYVINVWNGDEPDFTLGIFGVAVVAGLVYLVMSIVGLEWLERSAGRWSKAIYFAVQIALVALIQSLLAGSGAVWLVTMPLIATATTDLRGMSRWLVWIAAALTMILPIGIFGGWDNALFAGLMIFPAFVFVVIFVRLTQAAEVARLEAERLAGELEDANHQLASYVIQAEELATTQERNRLAREIHDNLGHYLTVVNVQIKAAQAVMDKDPERARVALEKAQGLTEDGLAAVRQSVSSLRESPIGARSLVEAVRSLAAETQTTGIVTTVQVLGVERPVDPRVELTLYRTVQEGLTNVRKHARASRADVELDYTNNEGVRLAVVDNGIGRAAGVPTTGFGLLGIRERVYQLGGTLEMGDNGPDHGHGFHLAVTLPSRPPAQLPPDAQMEAIP